MDFRFHVVDGVRGLDFESDGFTRQSFTIVLGVKKKDVREKEDDATGQYTDTLRQKSTTENAK